MQKNDDLFPIGVLAEATGVNTITLRAWERRYGLLKPQRTAKGHRLYSATDIQRVEQIVNYIKQGISVGKVRALLQLQQKNSHQPNEASCSIWVDYNHTFLQAATAFNLHKLNSLYNEIISLYPIEIISTRLLLPLLKTYQARQTAKYHGTIAEEHFLTTFISNRLAAHFQQLALTTSGKTLVFASLSSERHDLLLLLFGIHCMTAGFSVISLGTNTPLEQVLYAAEKISAAATVVFGQLSKHDLTVYCKSQKALAVFDRAADATHTEITYLDEDFTSALNLLKSLIKPTKAKKRV
jgi:DNA-binding transcriptional MerR regulator